MLQHDHHECAVQHRLRSQTLLLCLKSFCSWPSNARAEENGVAHALIIAIARVDNDRQARKISNDHYY